MPHACVIHWFRRDLRLSDNTSLLAAARSGLPVVPVYVLSRWSGQHAWTGSNRQAFLCGCLNSLASNLMAVGSRLVVRDGDPVEALMRLASEVGAVEIHLNGDPDPHGKHVEKRLRLAGEQIGVRVVVHHDVTLHPAGAVMTQDGRPFRVYTPFSKAWHALPKPEPQGKPELGAVPQLESLPLPDLSWWGLSAPGAVIAVAGERAARDRLKTAIASKVAHYAERRDIPSLDGTSRLSQDLRFGLVSIRTVYAAALRQRERVEPSGHKGIDVFIRELAWREFYMDILHHSPDVLREEFNPSWRGLAWEEPGELYQRWTRGETGFPIVDAGMRELLQTGHMHNRLRMITAMFLTKDLRHDWRLGESFFMQHLVDGEIASNNGGWQWSAGTGADAAPYFRIQNPWMQTARYDPEGRYIKRWLPELAHLPAARLCAPPSDGRPLAAGYPAPCVDHHAERERTLEWYRRHSEIRGG